MAFAVLNRPFGSEIYTGLALPGGFFEVALGTQNINAHFVTDVSTANTDIYIESVSDPNIIITPATHSVPNISANASRLLSAR